VTIDSAIFSPFLKSMTGTFFSDPTGTSPPHPLLAALLENPQTPSAYGYIPTQPDMDINIPNKEKIPTAQWDFPLN
jgi:hypothetical protein